MDRSFRVLKSTRYLSTPALKKSSASPSESSIRVETSPGFIHSSPKLLSRSRLENSTISSRAVSVNNFRVENDLDRKLVQDLNKWNAHISTSASIQRINDAETLYMRRVNKQIDVEQTVNSRRVLKNLTKVRSVTTERQVMFQKNIIITRNTKREKIDKSRDIARCAKEYEEELRNMYAKLEKEVQDMNSKRENLRERITEERQQVLDLEEELNYMKLRIKNENQEMKVKAKEMGQAMYAKFLNARLTSKDEYVRKEKENLEGISQLKDSIFIKSQKVPFLDSKVSKLKKDLEIIRTKQIEHYKSLLKSGKDSRSEGLSWILNSLFILNVIVNPEDFPEFLDAHSISTLYDISRISLEIEKKYETMLNTSVMKLDVSFSPIRYNRWNNIKSRIKLLTSRSNTARPEYLFNPVTNSYKIILNPCGTRQDANMSVDTHRTQLNNEISVADIVYTLKEKINNLKTDEVKRLIRECFMNKYNERFNLQLIDLISVIVGIENTDKYLTTIIHEQRRLGTNRRTAKTFKFNSKLNS